MALCIVTEITPTSSGGEGINLTWNRSIDHQTRPIEICGKGGVCWEPQKTFMIIVIDPRGQIRVEDWVVVTRLGQSQDAEGE